MINVENIQKFKSYGLVLTPVLKGGMYDKCP